MRTAPPLPVDDADARVLHEWAGSAGAAPALARRARIVLLAAQGLGPGVIAARVGCTKQTAVTWRERYRTGGLPALHDAPRSGRPASVDEAAVVARTVAGPPPGLTRWSTRSLAADLGISNGAVAGVWRAWGIRPADGGALGLVTDPPVALRDELPVGLLAAPPVHMLAVRAPGPHAAAGGGVPDRVPDLLAALAALPGPVPDAPVEAFLAATAGAGPPTRLVVDPAGADAARATGRGAASLHVASASAWPRTVQAVAVLAATTPVGRAAVQQLAAALTAEPTRAVTWLHPELPANFMQ
ncbi:MAG TPA: helix-turn-helix domain-containing protein [Pseudonocardia sp.]|nr:helix-turn-helix domain-containing protein [Pseudonocardia sp.]